MVSIIHGDCLKVMKSLPDKSIDLFVCDLPYGCLTGGAGKEKAKRIANVANRYRKECPPTDRGERVLSDGTIAPAGVLGGCAWDIPIDLDQFWAQVKRLCKDDHTPVLMFCSTKFGYELIKSNPDWFRYDLVWNKMRGVSFLAANKMPMRSHEMVYVFSKKGARYYRKDIVGDFPQSHTRGKAKMGTMNTYNGGQPLPLVPQPDNSTTRCVLSVVEANGEGRKKNNHPTQKPDDLYEWLITRYSKEGDTVLDPTAGSFASVFTAHRLNRKAIGIEKDDRFFAKALSVLVG